MRQGAVVLIPPAAGEKERNKKLFPGLVGRVFSLMPHWSRMNAAPPPPQLQTRPRSAPVRAERGAGKFPNASG